MTFPINKKIIMIFLTSILGILVFTLASRIYCQEVLDNTGKPIQYGYNYYKIIATDYSYWRYSLANDGLYITSDSSNSDKFCFSYVDPNGDPANDNECLGKPGSGTMEVNDIFYVVDNSTIVNGENIRLDLCRKLGSGFIVPYQGSRNYDECIMSIKFLDETNNINNYGFLSQPFNGEENVYSNQYKVYAGSDSDPIRIQFEPTT